MKLRSLRSKKSEKVDEVSVGYRPKPTLSKGTFLLVFGALLASASFYEGTAYQRTQDTSGNAATSTNKSALSASNSGSTQTDSFVRDHILGQVTAVNASSITVQDENSGQSATLTVSSSTQVEANNQAIKATNIQLGDLVIITKTSASSEAASKIIVTQGILGGSSTGGTSATTQSDTAAPSQSLESN